MPDEIEIADPVERLRVEVRRVAPEGDDAWLSRADAGYDLTTLLGVIEERIRQFRALKAEVEAEMVRWIKANGPIELMPGVRYYVGQKKDVHCRDVGNTLSLLLDKCNGDLGTIAQYLTSDPLKQGAIKKLVGDTTWAEHFEVVEKDELRESARATRLRQAQDQQAIPPALDGPALQKHDERYIR